MTVITLKPNILPYILNHIFQRYKIINIVGKKPSLFSFYPLKV